MDALFEDKLVGAKFAKRFLLNKVVPADDRYIKDPDEFISQFFKPSIYASFLLAYEYLCEVVVPPKPSFNDVLRDEDLAPRFSAYAASLFILHEHAVFSGRDTQQRNSAQIEHARVRDRLLRCLQERGDAPVLASAAVGQKRKRREFDLSG